MTLVTTYWLRATLVVGAILTIIALIRDELDGADAATIGAAIVAGLVALSINETVDQRRDREAKAKLREQREQAYQDVIAHLIESFTDGPKRQEHDIRRNIALWGSKTFVQKYSVWRKTIEGLAGSGRVAVPSERRREIQEALADVCLAARDDLGIEPNRTPSVQETAALLFDDYQN